MHVAVDLVVLVGAVTGVGALARRAGLPAPLLLLLVGVAASFVPRWSAVQVDSEVILVGLLPPLLYAAAIRTSLLDLRHNLRPIGLLSIGLVAVTTVGVGLVVHAVLPVPLWAAFALGAVVAPPDAVAATAIARRVGMPRRAVTILEGESLFNDATSLVLLRSAVAAGAGGVTAAGIGADFAVAALGGIAVGIGVTAVVGAVRRHVDDVVTDTALSFLTPFAAYLLAEEVHASGVLAVVVAGVLLGHKSQLLQSARARVFERSNWATIQFLLEHTVFLLIGLELRGVLADVADSPLGADRIVAAAGLTLATVIVLRPVFVGPVAWREGGRDGLRFAAALSWAGMRGVVTLAAAFVLPEDTPHRDVLVLLACVVTAGTLLLQGFSLPTVVRRLGLPAPDRGEDLLQQADVLLRAAAAGGARLDALVAEGAAPEVAERARRRSVERADAAWERLGGDGETPSAAYARVRGEMLEAERAEVLRIRDEGRVPHEVLEHVLAALDVEETILEVVAEGAAADRAADLRAPATAADACPHLLDAASRPVPVPGSVEGCEDCLAAGNRHWVHLRLCLACGHVACCDSSPGRHADAHHRATGHPVIRSFEPGEAWRWCFVDERLG